VAALDIGAFDESLTWDAGLRAALLDGGQLAAWQAQVDRLLVAEGRDISSTTCRCAPTGGWRRSPAVRGGSTRSRS
jgi:hypothetical protein